MTRIETIRRLRSLGYDRAAALAAVNTAADRGYAGIGAHRVILRTADNSYAVSRREQDDPPALVTTPARAGGRPSHWDD